MLFMKQCVFAVAGLIALTQAHSAPHNSSSSPVPPSQDPWYTAPRGWESKEPGSLLRLRRAPGNLTSVVLGTSAAWNILYRTTDSKYQPSWAVTTLFVPKIPNSKALLSYQTAYDSANVDDSPSFAVYKGLSDFPIWGYALTAGWFLNVPDYEGPNASFTAGVVSGHATLDSIRAVLSLKEAFGMEDGVRYGMWGYSGGALASEWAAELQVQYAPELEFAGAALGGLTPNISSVLTSITGSVAAGLAPSSIIGLTNQYPEVQDLLKSELKTSGPYNASTFLMTGKVPVSKSAATFAFKDIAQYFVDGLAAVFNPRVLKVVNSDGVMGYHGVPQMPLFVFKAIRDEISPVNDTDALVNKYCGVGANIWYERNTVGGHAAEAVNGAYSAFSFMNSVFEGTFNASYPTIGCTIRNVTVNVTSSTL